MLSFIGLKFILQNIYIPENWLVIANYFFLPTHRVSFFIHTFLYICNPQKEVIISWIRCCGDLVISREKVHMMNSHFFYMLAFDWLGFPDFLLKKKTSQPLQVHHHNHQTAPFNLVQKFCSIYWIGYLV